MAWYVMRDLTRANALRPAWKSLQEAGFEVYTPLTWKVRQKGGRKERIQVPVIHDLLFVDSTREALDPFVAELSTLQYRFVRGKGYGAVMEVNEAEMERFIRATASDSEPIYYKPEELTRSMVGRQVRIIGGTLNGFTGNLLSVKGMRKRRLLVEIPGMIAAAVEVSPDYIEFI